MTRHRTKYNLTNFIRSGVLLRVKNKIFTCVNVLETCEITLDRVWSDEDGEEILYLLPSYRGEKGRKFYKILECYRLAPFSIQDLQGVSLISGGKHWAGSTRGYSFNLFFRAYLDEERPKTTENVGPRTRQANVRTE